MRRVFALLMAAAWTLSGQGLPVTYERLLKADQEPGNWLMYSNTYNSWRFSRLNQVNTQNVKTLHVKWLFQGRHLEKFETTPLVADGIMYLTRPENAIYALDAATGRQLWMYEYRNPPRTFNCCGKVNRGLAMLGTTLFMNTLDMHVVAVDAKSGHESWKTEMYDYTEAGGYAATGAPLVVKDKLIVGMAGGVFGASTRFLNRETQISERGPAIPGRPAASPPGTAAPTTRRPTPCSGEPATRGRILTATSARAITYYSCSVLALDPDTGKLKWHYQFTPHDLHDWDSTQIPILLDGEFNGQPRKLLAWANRNGFFYLLDRTNGKFLTAKAFVKQTWAKGFDDNGRPEVIPGNDPTPEGNDQVWPGVDGGANWMSHRYSPLTKLMYVFARDERRTFSKNAVQHPTTAAPGAGLGIGGFDPTTGAARNSRFAPEESWGRVVAIDPGTGAIQWEHRVLTPPWGGVMATAGNLVFGGTVEGVVFALNATTGERLWTFAANGPVFSTPISYLANGKQLVSVPAGDVIITFGLD